MPRRPTRQSLSLTLYLTAIAALSPLSRAQTALAPPALPAPLADQIAALLANPAVARDHWGIYVTTLDGTPLYSLNEAQLFQPASNTKLFTTAAALALLGPDKTFNTRVAASGPITNGRLHGDLALIGDGDPNLSARPLPYTPPTMTPPQAVPPVSPLHVIDELADQIAQTGLKIIDGNVIGDDTLFPWEPYPDDWSIEDMLWSYGAPVSALSINDNRIKLTIAPAVIPNDRAANWVGTDPAIVSVEPNPPYYTIQNEAITGDPKSKWLIGIERPPGSHTLRIYGSIAADAAPEVEEIAIDDPAAYAAISLKQALTARGIAVLGHALPRHRIASEPSSFLDLEQSRRPIPYLDRRGDGKLVPCLGCWQTRDIGPVFATHQSFPLAEDVVVTNKVSQNLHAELLLHQLGVSYSDETTRGSTAQGAAVVRQFLVNAGIDPNDFIFYDGSGLSGHDLVTPRATAKLLQYAATQPWFATWKASLPIGGEDGSLASRFAKPPLKDHVFAKTGTLGEARALSGYLDCASGRTVIFSIMDTNHLPGTDAGRDVMDKIVAAIQAAE